MGEKVIINTYLSGHMDYKLEQTLFLSPNDRINSLSLNVEGV